MRTSARMTSRPRGRFIRSRASLARQSPKDDALLGVWRAEKPGFRYRWSWWPGGQPRVKGVDQRAGILPRSWEGAAAGEQQPAARRPARQGAQQDRPEVFHVLREQ